MKLQLTFTLDEVKLLCDALAQATENSHPAADSTHNPIAFAAEIAALNSSASFIPAGYRDAGQLEEIRARGYRSFYLRPAYFLDTLRRLRTWEDLRLQMEGAWALLHFLD